jgi:hypothetical protein
MFTRLALVVSLILLVYGYLCRFIGIYFFWESKSLGWAILLIGIIGLLSDRIKSKDDQNKKSIGEKIGIGLLVFILFLQCILVAVTPFTDAYESTKDYIKNNDTLRRELGEIRGFVLMPSGRFQKTTDSNGVYGNAEINLTIKGEKKYRDIVVYVAKSTDSPDWKVESLE